MRYWFLNALCGILVLFLLGTHMTTLYLDDLVAALVGHGGNALDWSQVSVRGKSGVAALIYVLFLGSALFHGLYGLHTMLVEKYNSPGADRRILVGCWAAGLLLFSTGTYATLSFYALSQPG